MAIADKLEAWISDLTSLPNSANAEHLYDLQTPAGVTRTDNLRIYLSAMAELRPSILLVGEAPGYRGSRRTGVPFTSEHILMGGMPEVGFYSRPTGYKRVFDGTPAREPTATIMWRSISQLGELPLLWSAFPHHPYQAGNPSSNRTPTAAEITLGRSLIETLMDLFQIVEVIAVGNIGKSTLDVMGVPATKVRHPAHGGARQFIEQLAALTSSDLRQQLQH